MTLQTKRGRVYDPTTRRWYKDGYAPSQLAAMFPMLAWCMRCGQETLSIFSDGRSVCALCSPVRGRLS